MKKKLILVSTLAYSLYAFNVQNVDILFKNQFNDQKESSISKNLSGYYKFTVSDYFRKPDTTNIKKIDQRRYLVNHLFVLKDSYKKLHGSLFFFYGNDTYNYENKFYHEFINNVNLYSYRLGIKELYFENKINNINVTVGKYIYDNSFSDIYSPQDIYKIYQLVSPSDYVVLGDWQFKLDYYTNNNSHIVFDYFPFFNYSKAYGSKNRWSNPTSSSITSNTNTINGNTSIINTNSAITLLQSTVTKIQQQNPTVKTITIESDYNRHGRFMFKISNDNKFSKSLTIGYGPIYGQYSIYQDPKGNYHAFNFSKLYLDLGLSKVIRNMKFYTEQYASICRNTRDSNIYQYVLGMSYNVTNSKILTYGLKSLTFNLEYINTNQFGLSKLDDSVIQTSYDILEPKKNINFKVSSKIGYKNKVIYFAQIRLHKNINNDQGIAHGLLWQHNYNDHLELNTGLELYRGGNNSEYASWKNNDRLKCSIKYTF